LTASCLDVLATSNNGCGTTLTNLVPLEGCKSPPAIDAVKDTNDPQHNGREETEQVGKTHAREAIGDVDETLHEAVVEESELGNDQRNVKLTKDHDNTESNADSCEGEDGETMVLVSENIVGTEEGGSVHVELALIGGRALAVNTIRMADAVVMCINGEVITRNVLRTSGGLLSPETSLEGKIFGITFLDKLCSLSSPLEPNDLVRTNPELVAAETLSVRESDLAVICYVPPHDGLSEKVIGISSDGHDTKNREQSTSNDASDHKHLCIDELAGAINFLSVHDQRQTTQNKQKK